MFVALTFQAERLFDLPRRLMRPAAVGAARRIVFGCSLRSRDAEPRSHGGGITARPATREALIFLIKSSRGGSDRCTILAAIRYAGAS